MLAARAPLALDCRPGASVDPGQLLIPEAMKAASGGSPSFLRAVRNRQYKHYGPDTAPQEEFA